MKPDDSAWDIHYVGEPIEVGFDKPPLFSKRPHCPQWLIWRDQQFQIALLVSEWRSYERRGRMALNMRPENLKKAAKKGSWGVGRTYFRVQTDDGRTFDLYYDRAPKGQQRAGAWYLDRELLRK